jgi:hypothetical protein
MQFIKTSNNKVEKILSGSKLPDDYTVIPNDHQLQVGDDVRFFNKNYNRKSIQQCIDEGLISVSDYQTAIWEDGKFVVKADYRNASYWYKNNGEKVKFQIGDIPDDTMTDQEPHDPDAVWGKTDGWYMPDGVKAERIRGERNRLLAECDYIMLPDYPLGDKSKWEIYRQSLRDVTKQGTFPDSVDWPKEPGKRREYERFSTGK